MCRLCKIALLFYSFLQGCSNYTPDTLAAYTWACDVERNKNRIKQCDRDDVEIRHNQLCKDHNDIKNELKKKNNPSSFEQQILDGKVEKRFNQFRDFLCAAFIKSKQNKSHNGAIRDFAAYAVLSQTIFNFLMYVFASLDDSKALKTLETVCKLLRFFEPDKVIKILVQCEDFYNKDSHPNLQQELTNLFDNISASMRNNVDSGALACVSEFEFSEKEIQTLLSTLLFLLSIKHFFRNKGSKHQEQNTANIRNKMQQTSGTKCSKHR